MTECYECSKLAELMAENNALRVRVDELTADVSQAVEDTAEHVTNKGEMLCDSREKLEADSQNKLDADLRGTLLLLVDDVAKTAHEQTFNKHLKVDAWWNAFVRITDRQAAITERHILTHPDERDEQIVELQREVDRLTRENISLARDLGECMAERDELIAEIDALEYRGELDEPRGTKVDINGEVLG